MVTRTRDFESNHIRSDKDPLEIRNILLSKIETLLDNAIADYSIMQQKSTYNNVKEIVGGLIAAAEKEKQIVEDLKAVDMANFDKGYESSSKFENSLFEHLLNRGHEILDGNDMGAAIMYALNISTELNTIYYILLNEYNHSAIKGSFRALQEIENGKIRKLDKLYENLIVKGEY